MSAPLQLNLGNGLSISEDVLSRSFTIGPQAQREIIFNIYGTDDEQVVQSLLTQYAPAVYTTKFDELLLDSISAQQDPLSDATLWRCRAIYRRLNENQWTFDFGGATSHINQGFKTVSWYNSTGSSVYVDNGSQNKYLDNGSYKYTSYQTSSSGTVVYTGDGPFVSPTYTNGLPYAPNFNGAINVSHDRVEGVDIPQPSGFNFSQTVAWYDADITTAYKISLANMCNCWNDAPFQGFAIGEVLFLGVTGTKRGDDRWFLTYKFGLQPSISGLLIGNSGNQIGPISKLGWDYTWILYQDYMDSNSYALIKQPTAVYVERVFSPADFNQLLIGTQQTA